MSPKQHTDTNEPSEDVTGREWKAFAGTNEYKTDLSVSDVDTPVDSVIGREWKAFAGTNEYKTDLSVSDVDTPVDSVIGREWNEFDGTHTDNNKLMPPEQISSAPDSQNRVESSMLSCD